MRRILLISIIFISCDCSALLFEKFLKDTHQTKSITRYRQLNDGLQDFIKDLYRGHLTKVDIDLLKETLKSGYILDLDLHYINDKLNDPEDRQMPYWNLRDLRKLVAYGPLFFNNRMSLDDKTAILRQLYYSELIQRPCFRKVARPLSIQIDLCQTHEWGNTDSAITCAILEMIDYEMSDDNRFAIIRAVRDLVPLTQFPGWVLQTLTDELPHFYRGLSGGYAEIAIAFLEILKKTDDKQKHILSLSHDLKPNTSFRKRLNYIRKSIK